VLVVVRLKAGETAITGTALALGKRTNS